jgi:hypothetical protein
MHIKSIGSVSETDQVCEKVEMLVLLRIQIKWRQVKELGNCGRTVLIEDQGIVILW